MKLLFSTSILICIASVIALYYKQQLLDWTTTAFDIANSYYGISNFTPTLLKSHSQTTGNHLYATEMSVHRAIRKVFLAVEQAEGAGARVRRSIGTPNLRNFSPFLMLDHFSIKPGAGFPDQYVSPFLCLVHE